MKTVRTWEDTLRFGHLGTSQNSHANSARVLEYFSDSYNDRKEAVRKAELFLSIQDYIARHATFFSKKGLVENCGQGSLSAEPALLRAVHFVFTLRGRPENINPKKVFGLARALEELETAFE
jgi:hypothetical protein